MGFSGQAEGFVSLIGGEHGVAVPVQIQLDQLNDLYIIIND
jgi:hypothetical protein